MTQFMDIQLSASINTDQARDGSDLGPLLNTFMVADGMFVLDHAGRYRQESNTTGVSEHLPNAE
jgi:hypothetical protein